MTVLNSHLETSLSLEPLCIKQVEDLFVVVAGTRLVGRLITEFMVLGKDFRCVGLEFRKMEKNILV